MLNFTPLARFYLRDRIAAARHWRENTEKVQLEQLQNIVRCGRRTRWGSAHVLNSVHKYSDFIRQVPIADYEDFRPFVMRMIKGERSVLWPGATTRFAQSSGTSGGKSKFIPITDDSLKLNHYAGTRDVLAHYLHINPASRILSGKAFILGGSYANEIATPPGVFVGDLSASLIDNMPRAAAWLRVPDKETALMEDWHEKLPALIDKAMSQNVTNISGVPSWFLTVLKGIIEKAGANTIHDVWPNLEVFFHGGVSMKPYRDEYARITDPARMHLLETYNASEGFFATQTDFDDPSMLLLLDNGVFYEFVDPALVDNPLAPALQAHQVEVGATYALLITAVNGLWRYAIGDTVRIESVNPLKITIAGRTKSFINVFGEEVMVYNTDAALQRACKMAGCAASDYTVAPIMPAPGVKGRHQWLVEWTSAPADIDGFALLLDKCLQDENSDYQAKRSGDIFLDPLQLTSLPAGTFDRWLASTGKLGGQRKVPRLCNDRRIVDDILTITNLK